MWQSLAHFPVRRKTSSCCGKVRFASTTSCWLANTQLRRRMSDNNSRITAARLSARCSEMSTQLSLQLQETKGLRNCGEPVVWSCQQRNRIRIHSKANARTATWYPCPSPAVAGSKPYYRGTHDRWLTPSAYSKRRNALGQARIVFTTLAGWMSVSFSSRLP